MLQYSARLSLRIGTQSTSSDAEAALPPPLPPVAPPEPEELWPAATPPPEPPPVGLPPLSEDPILPVHAANSTTLQRSGDANEASAAGLKRLTASSGVSSTGLTFLIPLMTLAE